MDYREEWMDVGKIEADEVVLRLDVWKRHALVDLLVRETFAFGVYSGHVEFPVGVRVIRLRPKTLCAMGRTICRFPSVGSRLYGHFSLEDGARLIFHGNVSGKEEKSFYFSDWANET